MTKRQAQLLDVLSHGVDGVGISVGGCARVIRAAQGRYVRNRGGLAGVLRTLVEHGWAEVVGPGSVWVAPGSGGSVQQITEAGRRALAAWKEKHGDPFNT